MTVEISFNNQINSCEVQEILRMFSAKFPDKNIVWDNTGGGIKTSSLSDFNMVKQIFSEIIEMNLNISVSASDTYDIREGDTSAQWWGSSEVYSVVENGKTVLKESSSSYWV